MNRKEFARIEAKANVFKALGHPSRVMVVNALADGEKCFCELTEMIGADKSTVSKHLSVLKQAGIIRDEKRGLMVFYTLRACCVLNFMNCVDNMISENIKELAEIHG